MPSAAKFHCGRRLADRKKLTLAQHCGLVEKPPPKLTASEWIKAKEKSKRRQDTAEPCPICKEQFLIKEKVILSCSHIFHKACLASFERYSKLQCCPVCRTTHYEKLSLKNSSRQFKHMCATRIQATFRGYAVRKAYQHKFKRPKDPEKCRAWFASKLESAASNLLLHIAADECEVDALCNEVDNAIADSRKVYEAVDARAEDRVDISHAACDYVVSNDPHDHTSFIDWHHVVEKALERGNIECPICIEALHRKGGHSSLAWLSCTHVFHADCILTFEEFHSGAEDGSKLNLKPFCPVCRAPYIRLNM